jgi:hypothetical protein
MPTVNIFLLYYIRKEEEENRRGWRYIQNIVGSGL